MGDFLRHLQRKRKIFRRFPIPILDRRTRRNRIKRRINFNRVEDVRIIFQHLIRPRAARVKNRFAVGFRRPIVVVPALTTDVNLGFEN